MLSTTCKCHAYNGMQMGRSLLSNHCAIITRSHKIMQHASRKQILLRDTCSNDTLLSCGQISLSPQKGLTVMVFSSNTGKLSLNPPSA